MSCLKWRSTLFVLLVLTFFRTGPIHAGEDPNLPAIRGVYPEKDGDFTLPFKMKWRGYFTVTYGTADPEESAGRAFSGLYEIIRELPEKHRPGINTSLFNPRYNPAEMGIGEQLMYGLGMMLIQMTAVELDRKINNDNSAYRR